MSYLVNIDMFDNIQKYCDKKNLLVSFYLDDITISSNTIIKSYVLSDISKIIKKHCHSINKKKSKTYTPKDFKKITDCVISKNKKLIVPNKTIYKIKKSLLANKNKLLGLINCVQGFKKYRYTDLKFKI